MSDMDEREQPPEARSPVQRAVGLASELGLAMGLMAAAMLLGALALGRWLDRALYTSPWLTILLLLAGAISSQFVLYRMAANAVAQLDRGAQHAINGAGLTRAVVLAAKALLLAVLPALAGVGLGLVLDRLLGTVILLTVLLALAGFVVSIMLLLRLVRAHRDAPQGDN